MNSQGELSYAAEFEAWQRRTDASRLYLADALAAEAESLDGEVRRFLTDVQAA